jgi:DNA-binding transcriptional regulator YiaG
MSSSKAGKTVLISRDEARARPGQTDWERVDAATDAEIAAWQSQEGLSDEQLDLSSARVIVPQTDVRQLRQELGLSRQECALRYRLSPRTVQHSEQENREPDGPARVLLWLIAKKPVSVPQELQTFQ